jgi:hypothetical protein
VCECVSVGGDKRYVQLNDHNCVDEHSNGRKNGDQRTTENLFVYRYVPMERLVEGTRGEDGGRSGR